MRLAVTSRRLIAVLLCVTIILSISILPTQAHDGPRIVIKIGQPGVWSLGQAHYLLEKMHRRNRNLTSKFPTDDDLDPNRISATRIDALRSSLAIEGQFDQAMGAKNSLELRRVREANARRETARADSTKKQAELDQTNNDLEEINEKIALLEEENKQSQEERERATPPAAPSAEENQRRKDLVLLKVRKTRKEEQRDQLKSDITALNTTANTEPAAPTLEEPALSGNNAALPTSKTFNDFMDKALKEAGKPDLSASMKLNNFIQGQYEIIANQLTLLKDEVGPDDRLVFLELPASIYTVDKKADDYVAQVEWRVSKFCDAEPSVQVQEDVIRDELKKQGKNDAEATEEMLHIDKLRKPLLEQRAITYAAASGEMLTEQEKQETARADRFYGKAKAYPITLEMIKKGGGCTTVDVNNRYRVRAVDIIPRQSALNVNEYHATVKQTAILAAFKFLIGFAGSVSYQRQRELYEQFVQQQIFASGYGKGEDLFGWTYGPQPGTRRISPGEKTTFAVLIVPRNTLALELKANSRFYKRQISPEDPDRHDVIPGSDEETFFLSVPGQRTQEFWVDGISYSPVKKGRRLTAVIDGNFFSPQMGVLVNGVPLEPVVSISRIAGGIEETDVQPADGVAGEYEITSSRQIIVSFTMGESYVGTPTIAVTSPEKTTAINFFDLQINHRDRYSTLSDQSRREPMFYDDFSEALEIEPVGLIKAVNGAGAAVDSDGNAVAAASQAKYKLIRLKGSGLRPNAEILLNNQSIPVDPRFDDLKDVLEYVNAHPTPRKPFAIQESTKSYLIYAPDRDKWKIGYLQLTRQGYENGSAVKDFSSPTFGVEVQNYRFLPGARRAEVDLNVLSKEANLDRVDVEDPASGRCSSPIPFDPDEGIFRVKCFVPADNNGKIERTSILIRAVVHTTPAVKFVFADVALPVKPQLFSLYNPRTGRPEGFATEGATIVISGANLQGVTSVFFGDQKGEISGTSPDSITVKVPTVTGVPKGQALAVPIILQTAAGKTPTGAIYTYQGEPLPPNVIVWPPYRPKEK